MPILPSLPADLGALRAALTARIAPADAIEEHWVGEIAFALWQQQRLQALAALVLAAAESGTSEPDEAATRLPSLATLARYRARIERDLKLARHELEAARQARPPHPAPANDTGEPEGQSRAAPEPSVVSTPRSLNRRERRRLEALHRKVGPPATDAALPGPPGAVVRR